MLDTGGNTSSSGNWGWLVAIVTGIITGIHAVFHRRKPLRDIPTRNAEEIFERLEYIESNAVIAGKSDTRIWAEISAIRQQLVEIQEQAVIKSDLIDCERRLKRSIDRGFDSAAGAD